MSGYELIGAGMLILAGGGRGFPLDYDELSAGHASAMSGGCDPAKANADRALTFTKNCLRGGMKAPESARRGFGLSSVSHEPCGLQTSLGTRRPVAIRGIKGDRPMAQLLRQFVSR